MSTIHAVEGYKAYCPPCGWSSAGIRVTPEQAQEDATAHDNIVHADEHSRCRHCGAGIHLETGDMGFGDVTIWLHDDGSDRPTLGCEAEPTDKKGIR